MRDTGRVIVLLVGVFVAISTIQFSQAEDMGVFLSEAALLSRGARLYTEIFEIKDPLYLWSAGLAFRLFGKSGPYLLDGLLIVLASGWTYALAKFRKLSEPLAVLVSTFFVLSLAGAYFQSFRSGTAALALVPLLLVNLERGRSMRAGLTAVAIVGFKMAYVPLLLGPLLVLAITKQRREVFRILAGTLIGTLTIFAALVARGEFGGYLRMVNLNFEYRTIYPRVVGLQEGIRGHLNAVNAYGSNWRWLVAITLASIAIGLAGRKTLNIGRIAAGVGLQVGVLVVLGSSTMWVHHLQVLAAFALGSVLVIAEVLRNSMTLRRLALVAIILIPAVFQTTGGVLPLRPRTSLGEILSPKWAVPPEVTDIPSQQLDAEVTFARLGPNDDMGLAAFLPAKWKLVCPDFAQYGHETEKMLLEMKSCFASKPDVVFVSPGFEALARPFGIYDKLKTVLRNVINENFACDVVEGRPGASLCTRRRQ